MHVDVHMQMETKEHSELQKQVSRAREMSCMIPNCRIRGLQSSEIDLNAQIQ